jgi:hypothetical protein
MDHNVARAVTAGLRLRGVDVLAAHEDGASDMADSDLLDRATELGRVLFTRDDDFLAMAALRQKVGIGFKGVIYAHQMRVPIGKCIEDLEIIAKCGVAEDFENDIQFLPL